MGSCLLYEKSDDGGRIAEKTEIALQSGLQRLSVSKNNAN